MEVGSHPAWSTCFCPLHRSVVLRKNTTNNYRRERRRKERKNEMDKEIE
jgi:hypothetical protein